MPERNALAELEDDLNRICYHLTMNQGLLLVIKAKRIIAELAKVLKDYEDNYGSRGYYISCRDAFETCRAIAEEGADNGKH